MFEGGHGAQAAVCSDSLARAPNCRGGVWRIAAVAFVMGGL